MTNRPGQGPGVRVWEYGCGSMGVWGCGSVGVWEVYTLAITQTPRLPDAPTPTLTHSHTPTPPHPIPPPPDPCPGRFVTKGFSVYRVRFRVRRTLARFVQITRGGPKIETRLKPTQCQEPNPPQAQAGPAEFHRILAGSSRGNYERRSPK